MVHIGVTGMTKHSKETLIGVTAFKAQCLAMIDDVAQGKTSRVVLMKHNKPIALVVPFAEASGELWGALRGTVTISPETDLTQATGEAWDAET